MNNQRAIESEVQGAQRCARHYGMNIITGAARLGLSFPALLLSLHSVAGLMQP